MRSTERAARREIRQRLGIDYDTVVAGSATGVLEDPNIPGNVLVRIKSSNGFMLPFSVGAPKNKIALQVGDAVELAFSRGKFRIVGIDPDGVLASGGNPLAKISDTDFNRQENLATLCVTQTQTASTTLKVKGWNPIVNGTAYEFPGGEINIATANGGGSYIPSSGNMAYIVIFVKNDYLTLEAKSSTARSMTDVDLNIADINEAIALRTAGSTPVWAIPLSNGQTTITQNDILNGRDLRNLVNNLETAGTTGNVTGPGSSTDRAIATWNGTAGTTLRNNANATIDASGNLTAASLISNGSITQLIGGVSLIITHAYTGANRTTGLVLTTPGATSDNVILPSATGIVPLTIRAFDSSSNLNEWKTSGGTTVSLVDTNGNFRIGSTGTVDTDYQALIQVNTNTKSGLIIRNPNGGTASRAEFRVLVDAGIGATFYTFSSGYTTSGLFVAQTSLLDANGTGGLRVGTSNASGDFGIFTGGLASSNIRMSISSTGNVTVGTAGASTARLNVNAAASGIGLIVRANATTPGNMQEWQNSGGVAVAFVDSAGNLRVRQAAGHTGAAIEATSSGAGTVVMALRSTASQTGDVVQIQSSTGVVRFAYGGDTVASGASATLRSMYAAAQTITLTGSTNNTSATGFNFFEIGRPTYSAANAQTITNAATVYIANSPLGAGAGGATITNPYSLWVDDGTVRFDGRSVWSTTYDPNSADATIHSYTIDFVSSGGISGNNNRALALAANVQIATDSSNRTITGAFTGITFTSSNTANLTGTSVLIGLRSTSFNDHATRTIPNTIGVDGASGTSRSGGTTTSAIGVRGGLVNTGAVTSGYALYSLAPTGAGTITNLYGLYIEAMSAGATLNYAIYTNAGLVRFGDNVVIADAKNIVLDTTTGTKIGTATGQKLGFWNATPVVQQVLATGAGRTVDDVISFLQTIGLCKQS